jgi:hypothetical protein
MHSDSILHPASVFMSLVVISVEGVFFFVLVILRSLATLGIETKTF